MIRFSFYFIILLLALWSIGFAWFAKTPSPSFPIEKAVKKADAIIVLTGDERRIETGLQLLKDDHAPHVFISGVDQNTTKNDLKTVFAAYASLFECCVTLGKKAKDTRGNAIEIRNWSTQNAMDRIILVTSDYHMKRALIVLSLDDIQIYSYAVESEDKSKFLKEYHKYLFEIVRKYLLNA